jgi:hypothetical protein
VAVAPLFPPVPVAWNDEVAAVIIPVRYEEGTKERTRVVPA